jgi:hypothetical protein
MTAATKTRNDLFLRWADEGLTPGMVRKRWNAISDEDRIAVCGSSAKSSILRGMLAVNLHRRAPDVVRQVAFQLIDNALGNMESMASLASLFD